MTDANCNQVIGYDMFGEEVGVAFRVNKKYCEWFFHKVQAFSDCNGYTASLQEAERILCQELGAIRLSHRFAQRDSASVA